MAEEDIKKLKILYITFRLPWPPEKGGYNLRAFNLGKILAETHYVDLLTIIEKKEEERYLNNLERTFNSVIYFYHPKIFKYFGAFKAIFSSKPLQVGYFFSPKIYSWIKNNHQKYDLVFCSEIRTAEYIKSLKIKKIIDFVDAISLNYQQTVKYVNFFWKIIYFIENKRLINYEREIVNKFDLSFIVTQKEKDFIRKKEEKKMIVLPNGVKENIFKRELNKKEENWISFLGKMDYLPNEDACLFFARKIFPKIKEKYPELFFYIVGISPTKKILNLKKNPGIKITGFIEDPYHYLERSKIIVASLRVGAGIQNKILEAMILGKTVVTTPIGASGIPEAKNGEHFIVVDHKNPDEMTDKIIALMENDKERKRIGTNAKKLILENYNWNKIGKILLENIINI